MISEEMYVVELLRVFERLLSSSVCFPLKRLSKRLPIKQRHLLHQPWSFVHSFLHPLSDLSSFCCDDLVYFARDCLNLMF